jgi:hypothetical protein
MHYRGIMELWLEGGIDLEGFETQLLYGLSLCLLAVATEKGRPRLLRHLRDLERQLDRRTQQCTKEPDEQRKEVAQ